MSETNDQFDLDEDAEGDFEDYIDVEAYRLNEMKQNTFVFPCLKNLHIFDCLFQKWGIIHKINLSITDEWR